MEKEWKTLHRGEITISAEVNGFNHFSGRFRVIRGGGITERDINAVKDRLRRVPYLDDHRTLTIDVPMWYPSDVLPGYTQFGAITMVERIAEALSLGV